MFVGSNCAKSQGNMCRWVLMNCGFTIPESEWIKHFILNNDSQDNRVAENTKQQPVLGRSRGHGHSEGHPLVAFQGQHEHVIQTGMWFKDIQNPGNQVVNYGGSTKLGTVTDVWVSVHRVLEGRGRETADQNHRNFPLCTLMGMSNCRVIIEMYLCKYLPNFEMRK